MNRGDLLLLSCDLQVRIQLPRIRVRAHFDLLRAAAIPSLRALRWLLSDLLVQYLVRLLLLSTSLRLQLLRHLLQADKLLVCR